jgi:hypothetical protein
MIQQHAVRKGFLTARGEKSQVLGISQSPFNCNEYYVKKTRQERRAPDLRLTKFAMVRHPADSKYNRKSRFDWNCRGTV